jgi:hypothetical protein
MLLDVWLGHAAPKSKALSPFALEYENSCFAEKRYYAAATAKRGQNVCSMIVRSRHTAQHPRVFACGKQHLLPAKLALGPPRFDPPPSPLTPHLHYLSTLWRKGRSDSFGSTKTLRPMRNNPHSFSDLTFFSMQLISWERSRKQRRKSYDSKIYWSTEVVKLYKSQNQTSQWELSLLVPISMITPVSLDGSILPRWKQSVIDQLSDIPSRK